MSNFKKTISPILILGALVTQSAIATPKTETEKTDLQKKALEKLMARGGAYVTLQGDTLYYQGDVNPRGLTSLKTLYNDAKTNPTTLHINSGGGVTIFGLAIGEWVAEKKLDIKVTNMCFSSCANYIFPAGNKKYIGQFALVGWHGDEQSSDYYRQHYQNISLRDYMRTSIIRGLKFTGEKLTPEQIEQRITENLAKKKETYKKFTEFYTSRGLSPKIPGAGHTIDKWAKQLKSGGKIMGWTYTPAVMEQMGIKNVILADGKWIFADDNANARTYNGSRVLLIDRLK